MIEGALVAESMRVGSALEDPPLVLRRVARIAPEQLGPDQPREWTLIEFEAEEDADRRLAAALAAVLRREGGWYADYTTAGESVIVFAGRTFRHPRGDASGRAEAAAYARSVGVPEAQLDWRG